MKTLAMGFSGFPQTTGKIMPRVHVSEDLRSANK